MESCLFLAAIMKSKTIYDAAKSQEGFLNVASSEEDISLFWKIVFGKCFIAAHATSRVLNPFTTITLIFVSCILSLINSDWWSFPVMIFNVGITAIRQPRNFWLTYNWIGWCLISVHEHCHFFLDIYVVITILMLILKMYSNELEKGITLILLTLCLNWWVDSCKGSNTIDIYEVVIILFAQFCLICALKPSNENYRFFYQFTCHAGYFVLLSKMALTWHRRYPDGVIYVQHPSLKLVFSPLPLGTNSQKTGVRLTREDPPLGYIKPKETTVIDEIIINIKNMSVFAS